MSYLFSTIDTGDLDATPVVAYYLIMTTSKATAGGTKSVEKMRANFAAYRTFSGLDTCVNVIVREGGSIVSEQQVYSFQPHGLLRSITHDELGENEDREDFAREYALDAAKEDA